MPTHLQVNLLTVLQRHEVRPVGGKHPIQVDVRVLAATNRDLREDVAEGRFREDLFFRLNVVALEIPPLRERAEDLPHLIGRFIRHFAGRHDRRSVSSVDEAAMAKLLEYPWPGNVREVVNVMERAVLLCSGPADRPRRAPRARAPSRRVPVAAARPPSPSRTSTCPSRRPVAGWSRLSRPIICEPC